ncbi:DUF416 family protein [Rapidithrix thailandica]|uniref:DUF416 family protein n=1 Tax=Rapidithrix thailandica TaxID=413964 RepID=A0AAW9SDQ0_9BACT
MGYLEYKEDLKQRLTGLSTRKLATFSICCFQRIFGLYPEFVKAFNADKSVEISNISEFIWEKLTKEGHFENNIASTLPVIESLLPSENLRGWQSSISINVCICLDVSARVLIEEHKNAEIAGGYVYDTISQVIYSLVSDKFISDELEDKIHNSSIIQDEIQHQFNLILELKSISILDNKGYIESLKNEMIKNTHNFQKIKNAWFNEQTD